MATFAERHQSQLERLPVDLRDEAPEDDVPHVAEEAVDRVLVSTFAANERGKGSAQHHPRMKPARMA